MKAAVVFLLVAALVTLPFTSASPANLGLRQGPAIIACTQNADCKAAASYWNDCQTATILGLPQAPHSEQKNCLCSNGQGASPSHPDWYSKLTSCIQCIENGDGFHDAVLNPLQALQVNFCSTGELTYDDFVLRAHQITANVGFALELPEAVLVSTQAARSPSETCETSTSSKTSSAGTTSTHAAEVTSSSAPVARGCNYDNCLRQAIRSEDVVVPFCKTYTSAVQTSTAGFPAYVSMCNNQPKSISSACTCLLSAQTPTQSPTATQSHTSAQSQTPIQSHTSSNGGIATTKSSAQPSRHTHTSWVTTILYTTRTESGHSSTVIGTSSTSCTTTPGTSSTPVVKSSTTTTPKTSNTTTQKSLSSTSAQSSTSIRTSSSTPTQSPTPVPTSSSTSTAHSSTTPGTSSTTPVTKSSTVPVSVSSTSSSAAPTSTTWVTLPASDGMKACAASQDCVTGNSLYYQCLNAQSNGNQTGSWNCFCKTNIDGWESSVLNCTSCVVKNLPDNPAGNLLSTYLIPAVTKFFELFCNETYPYKDTSMSKLDLTGFILTKDFESPIDLFDMYLLDAPPPAAGAPSSIVPSSTRTIVSSVTVIPLPASSSTSSLVVPASSGTSTGTTLSTQTTSSGGLITATPWITHPASQAMKQCQANDCQPAADVFNACIFTKLNSTNEDPIFDCFCTAKKALWQSTLSNCTNCVAAALPAYNNATGQFQAGNFKQVEDIRSLFCNQTEEKMSNATLTQLGNLGHFITTSWQVPINFFGMTLLTEAPIGKRDLSLLPRELLDEIQY